MKPTYEYDSLLVTDPLNLQTDLNERGKNGWKETSLPPFQSTFGLKILLRRRSDLWGTTQSLNESEDQSSDEKTSSVLLG